jgi:Holliday junction resolvase RusA-like endonuclease
MINKSMRKYRAMRRRNNTKKILMILISLFIICNLGKVIVEIIFSPEFVGLAILIIITCRPFKAKDSNKTRQTKTNKKPHKSTYKPAPSSFTTTTTTKEQVKEWQVINKHGFSVNKMYTCSSDGKRLVCSLEYESWRIRMLHVMETSKLKSLEEMNVDPNKPMKIEIEFKLVRGSDTDNPIKSFLDTLVKYYGLKDDNNFMVINVSRDFTCANSYSDGRIKFRIENI